MDDKPQQPRFYERSQAHDVFSWLDDVRQRPGMWLRERGLRDLEDLVWGYYAALHAHHLDEGVPEMTRHFSSWLRLRTGWSLSVGWAKAIERHTSSSDSALERFFTLVDDYRKLRPTTICHALLTPRHSPTGTRCLVGFGLLMPPPQKIDVVQYQHEPLHFLRFHYPEGPENGSVLITDRGNEATTADDARQWAQDEFQIQPEEWVHACDRG
jgi:hypothetical protein